MKGEATQFKPGKSGNPNGRKKGSKSFSTLFNEAVRHADYDLFEHLMARAKVSDPVLVAVLGKIVAQKSESKLVGDPNNPIRVTCVLPESVAELISAVTEKAKKK